MCPPSKPSFIATSLLLLTLTAVTVAGVPDSDGGDSGPTLTERIIAEENLRATRIVGVGRIALSHPQVFSASLGTVFSRQPEAFECVSTCDHIGPLLQVEAGTGSAQLSAGYARVLGDRRRDGFLLTDIYLAFGIKGALLRTYGNTRRQHRHRTYLGVEGEFTITNVNLTVGAFRRISDEPSRDRWLTVIGVGWGF